MKTIEIIFSKKVSAAKKLLSGLPEIKREEIEKIRRELKAAGISADIFPTHYQNFTKEKQIKEGRRYAHLTATVDERLAEVVYSVVERMGYEITDRRERR